MKEQLTTAEKKNKKGKKYNTHHLSPHPNPNGCGSVRNDDIFNLHLGSGAGHRVIIPCLLQDTSHIY